ncbi:uncharacterized protein LOC124280270 [Haliotis rubra]|uniref:uncharacterized protein LOC124280270 n=1 Tax=Haliotis rubra TaxID=36100 RepID=UPI001EE56F3B|nr:uncharacterized protein LOC124280270 [Haliotis rubra]XP_046572123.1 uncharacterized protein LOC124280270 [Haliotis rubra]
MSKTRVNIANGVSCAVVTGSGITFSVLVYVLFDKILQAALKRSGGFGGYAAYASSPVWSIGLAFVFPGFIGTVSSCARCKGGYITQMVFCILTLIFTGIIFIICVLALGAFSRPDNQLCRTEGDKCVCEGSKSASAMTCEDLNDINSIAVGIVAMVVVGWIMTLVATILGGVLACER